MIRMVFNFFLCLTFVNCFSPCSALDPERAITQYVHQKWGTNDGLPQSTVHSIVQTRDGYLWIATQEGLVRFDGHRFVVFDMQTTKEFKDNWIMKLMQLGASVAHYASKRTDVP